MSTDSIAPRLLAAMADPNDGEFLAAGTLLQPIERHWELVLRCDEMSPPHFICANVTAPDAQPKRLAAYLGG